MLKYRETVKQKNGDFYEIESKRDRNWLHDQGTKTTSCIYSTSSVACPFCVTDVFLTQEKNILDPTPQMSSRIC